MRILPSQMSNLCLSALLWYVKSRWLNLIELFSNGSFPYFLFGFSFPTAFSSVAMIYHPSLRNASSLFVLFSKNNDI